jgi:glycerol-3-phosphate acyltransferase PlsX
MRIAVDAMGGDRAPAIVVRGAVRAAAQLPGHDIILVGRAGEIQAEMKHLPDKAGRIRVEHADSVVSMSDSPVEALRRKGDTSIGRCAELAKSGEADAILSAGNTGAAVAAAALALGTLEGIRKPGIAAPFPTTTGGECVVVDVGANVKPKPEHLFDYGIMASEYVSAVTGKPSPTVGLLNVGAEDAKGTDLVKQTHALFTASHLNFAGNVEGPDIFQGKVDAVVCDGFVGNVLLKVAEGVCDAAMSTIRNALGEKMIYRLGARLCAPALRKVRRELNSSAYGGAQLLGVNGICIISHGSSDAEAIRNAIRVAVDLCNKHVNDRIVKAARRAKGDPADARPRQTGTP